VINRDRLLDTFLELVRIDSPSGEEAAISAHIANRFRELGLAVEISEAGNVIARMDGEGESILLSAHMDNVMPCRGVKPVIEEGVIRSDGTTVLGGDDKAGVAVILEVLQTILEKDLPHPPVEAVITVSEEVGLAGAKHLDMDKLRSKIGIGLDMGGEIGSIAISAPYHDNIRAVVRGKAAHAGACPEEGINAIVVAAEAITNMRIGRIDEETTANIGVIQGGTATNIVPDRVEIKGEARSRDEEKLRAQTASMVESLRRTAQRHGATVDIDVHREYVGYSLSEEDRIVQLLVQGVRAVGLEPLLVPVGGGSDANVFNARGIQVTNISVGMEKVHTTEEYIALDDMATCAEIVLASLQAATLGHRLGKQGGGIAYGRHHGVGD